MGEKELMVSTPLTSRIQRGGRRSLGDLLSIAQGRERDQHWVLTKGGYQPSRGIGPHLSGIVAPILIQKNSGKAGLDGNTILMCEDPSQLDKPVKDEHAEAEALV
ncbi:hypothetical protein CR513_15917, partial [Mucuna pruriens]